MVGQPDYDTMAVPYARHRRVCEIVVAELLRGAPSTLPRKALEIGCGTGNHIAEVVRSSGGQGWGVDPSPVMLSHAPADARLHFSQGGAEHLPFQENCFHLAFSVNVIHHVGDPTAYFREGFRVLVPGGRICTVTDSEEIIRKRRPLAEYWPETIAADLARYPPIPWLRRQMAETGFVGLEEHGVEWTEEITDAGPYRDKAFSCLHRISKEAFQKGLQRFEKALDAGRVEGRPAYTCLWGTVP